MFWHCATQAGEFSRERHTGFWYPLVTPMKRSYNESEAVDSSPASKALPWRLLGWLAAGILLLTPLVAMQFTEEVRWTPGDFLVFGAMLFLAGIALEWVFRAGRNMGWRLGAGLAVLVGFGLLWAQGAVGLVGDGNNLASFAVLAVAGLVIVAGLFALARRKTPGPGSSR
jgi:hypothetical protein